MTTWADGARWRAAGTALLLLVAGGVVGVAMDRLWLSRSRTEVAPLTAEAMAARLDLSSSEETRLRALLDSLHSEVLTVVDRRPDSLRTVVHVAQQRIEAALPAGARVEFRNWMNEHHERLARMHGGSTEHGATHRAPPAGGHAEPHRRQ